jgi:GxxExxY protein
LLGALGGLGLGISVAVTRLERRPEGARAKRTLDEESDMLVHEELTEQIIGKAIEVHDQLGPGLLEGVYAPSLCRELALRGLRVRKEVAIPVTYKGLAFESAYRLDIIVNDSVIIEVKAVDALLAIHEAQLLTYMKLTEIPVGLLINFNVALLRDGIKRRVLTPLSSSRM